MKRRILSLLLVCIMVIGMTPMVSFADVSTASWAYPSAEPSQPFASGDGTESNPYIIATAQQLANLAYMTNKDENRQTYANTYFKLGNSIDLGGNSWTKPIADVYNYNFQGTFDGAGHTITNFSSAKGLFNTVGTNGVVKNLTISGSVTSKSTDTQSGAFGAVALYNNGTIQDCVNGCAVDRCGRYVGGIVGMNNSTGTIIGCVNEGEIIKKKSKETDTNGASNAGGIAGDSYGQIVNCHNKAPVGQGIRTGGLVGNISGGTVVSCYNSGNIDGIENSGGIAGANSGKIVNCYNTAVTIKTQNSNYAAGGIAGRAGGSTGEIQNCYSNTATISAKTIGGIIGEKDSGASTTITNCYWLTAAGITSACGVELTVTNCDSFDNLNDTVNNDDNVDNAEVTLVQALNAWVDANSSAYPAAKKWEVASSGSNPTFVNKTEATINLPATSEGTYGTNITLTASVSPAGENGAWSWTVPSEKFIVVGESDQASIELKPLTTGTAINVTVAYESDTHLGSATVAVDVKAKELTITGVTAEGRAYIENDKAVKLTGGALESVVNNDDVDFTLGEGTMSDANAGTNKAVTTNITLKGAASGNYTLTQPTDIKVNIAKAIPTYTTPTDLTATFGQTLANVNIAANTGWSWEEAATNKVGEVGTVTHAATYTPTDTTNYNTLTGLSVPITVTKADAKTLRDIEVPHVAGINTEQRKELGLAGMPSDAKPLTFATSGAAVVSSGSIETPVVWSIGESGTLTYTISGGAIGDTVTFPIKISSENYADTTVNVVVTLAEKAAAPVNPGSNKPSRPSSKPAAPTEEQKPTDEQTTGSAVTPAANPFTDVDENDFFSESVLWAVENGITEGTAKTKFSPYKSCTRAEALTFIWRANGSPTPSSVTIPFTDVDEDAYYINAILWGIENGITNGLTDTTFGPDKICARAEILTFLWRASGSSQPASTANPFVDVSAGAYYMNPVLWGVDEEITNGTSETTFGPDDSCTRGQIVTFLYRDMVE